MWRSQILSSLTKLRSNDILLFVGDDLAMAKRSKRKNIILTNLPAAIALILMAVALKITLKFSFIISLLILIIIYFILGVLIELIIDKIDTKKKKTDLFKKYAEGKSGRLPAFGDGSEEDDIDYEVRPQKEAFEASEKDHQRFAVGSLYETEEEKSPAFIRKEESASEEPETAQKEEIPEKAIGVFTEKESEPEEKPELPEKSKDELIPEHEPDSVNGSQSDSEPSELSEGADEKEDSIFDIRLNDLQNESPRNQDSDNAFHDFFAKRIDEMENKAETATEAPETNETAPGEETEAESEANPVPEGALAEIEKVEDREPSEGIAAEPISEEDTASASVEAETEADASESVPEAETEVEDEAEPEMEKETPDDPKADEELIEALKDVGAIGNESAEDIPSEEADARRSLFDENDDFDAGLTDKVKKNTSIIFGSVPDTDDDFEYIPVADAAEPPITAQKGKVKVDARKIDDLYSFKKSKSGEKFFGRKKK